MYLKENKPEKTLSPSLLIGAIIILSILVLFACYFYTIERKQHFSDYIYLENQLLFQLRDSEFKKNHFRLEVLRCQGVPQSKIDSAKIQLISIYQNWNIEDSTYISNKYLEHNITDRVYQNNFPPPERE